MDGGGGGVEQKENKGISTYTKRVALASLPASVAEASTFPIDIIKTRLQLHGEHHCHHSTTTATSSSVVNPSNAFRVALHIWRSEGGGGFRGVSGFHRGLPPAILRHLFYTPMRIVGYEHLRSGGGFVLPAADSLVGRAFSGGISVVIAQVVASPADLIKVRMQAYGRLVSQGLQPRYVSIADAFRKIIRMEGVKGL